MVVAIVPFVDVAGEEPIRCHSPSDPISYLPSIVPGGANIVGIGDSIKGGFRDSFIISSALGIMLSALAGAAKKNKTKKQITNPVFIIFSRIVFISISGIFPTIIIVGNIPVKIDNPLFNPPPSRARGF